MIKIHKAHFIIYIIILLYSCTPTNKKPPKGLEGTWLSVGSVVNGRINTFYQGYLMDIKPGKRIFQHCYSNTIVEENVTFTDSSIILEDSSKIQIGYIGPDSLQLIFPWDNATVTYVRLAHKESPKITINEKDLFKNEWYLLDGKNKHRVDFIDYDFEIFNYDKTFKIAHNIRGWGEYSGWDLMCFDGQTYLISTALSNFEPDIYQIIDFKQDTLNLIYYDIWETKGFKTLELVKSPVKSQKEYNDLKNQLTNHEFVIQDYSFSSHFEEGTSDTVFIKRIHHFFKEFGMNRKMTFKFTEDSLFVFNSTTQYIKGTWELSKDNQVLKVTVANEPLSLFFMNLEMNKKMHLRLNGYFGNINNIYQGYQIKKLELVLDRN